MKKHSETQRFKQVSSESLLISNPLETISPLIREAEKSETEQILKRKPLIWSSEHISAAQALSTLSVSKIHSDIYSDLPDYSFQKKMQQLIENDSEKIQLSLENYTYTEIYNPLKRNLKKNEYNIQDSVNNLCTSQKQFLNTITTRDYQLSQEFE